MKTSKTLLAAGAVLASTMLAACGGTAGGSTSQFPKDSKMAQIASAGKVRIGILTEYPLLGEQTLNGYDGFDVRLGRDIGEKLGLSESQIEFVPVTTPTKVAFLQQGKVDLVLAGLSETAERAKVIDFAGPYLNVPEGLMVKAGNPKGIHNLDDLAGKKLCLPSGSNAEEWIRQNKPAIAASLITTDSSAKCRDAVLDGTADASTTDAPVIAAFVAQSKGQLQAVNYTYLNGNYGIGVAKSTDKTFCKWVEQSLSGLEADGTWAKEYDATLGTVLGKAPQPPKVGSCDTPILQ